jgi:hypothetical protein
VFGQYEQPGLNANQNNNVLTQFDFSAIEEADPAVAQGQVVLYDKEVPFEIRVQSATADTGEVGQLETIKVKVLTMGQGAGLVSVSVELTSESDLFFHHTHTMDAGTFRVMQDNQVPRVPLAAAASPAAARALRRVGAR